MTTMQPGIISAKNKSMWIHGYIGHIGEYISFVTCLGDIVYFDLELNNPDYKLIQP